MNSYKELQELLELKELLEVKVRKMGRTCYNSCISFDDYVKEHISPIVSLMLRDYFSQTLGSGWVSLEELSKLNTKRLLAYFKKYKHQGYFGGVWDEISACELERRLVYSHYFNQVKNLLNEREHVEK